MFTVSSSSWITWLFLLSHLFYTFMCLIIHSLYRHLSTFTIMQYYIYFTSTNPIISLHRHFLQQYSVYSIISYSISYNSFHICFIFYLIVVFQYVNIYFVWGLKSLTCYIYNNSSIHLSITVSVFRNFQPVRLFSHFSYKNFVQLV